jgi:hypothetical protein
MEGRNYHILEARYRGATMSGGAKCIIHSPRFHQTRSIHYDYSARDILEMAVKYLKEKGFTILGHAEATRGYYIISSTFKEM